MSLELKPSLIRVNGRLVENYERETRATNEAKQVLGLPTTEPVDAAIGVASISEYVVFSTENVSKDQEITFYLERIGQACILDTLVVDQPDTVVTTVKVKDSDGDTILEKTLDRYETPFKFPDFPLPPVCTVSVSCSRNSKYIQLSAKPVVILEQYDNSPLPPEPVA